MEDNLLREDEGICPMQVQVRGSYCCGKDDYCEEKHLTGIIEDQKVYYICNLWIKRKWQIK